MMKLVFYLLAAAAASGATAGSRGGEVERVGRRVWETSSGVAVICGRRRDPSDRRDSSDRAPAPSLVEAELSGLLDSVCRYLVGKDDVWVADRDASIQPPAQYDDIFAEISYDDSVRYNV